MVPDGGLFMAAEGVPQPDRSDPSLEPLSYIVTTELLSIAVRQLDPAVVVVHVAGEVDMLTGPALEDRLKELLAIRPKCLVIDLSQISFLGSTGLQVLLNIRTVATRQGTALRLSGTEQGMVARVLNITGLALLFDILPTTTDQR
jgi:anti-sigma B factor antagonist